MYLIQVEAKGLALAQSQIPDARLRRYYCEILKRTWSVYKLLDLIYFLGILQW
jgi:hypothetical protein